MAYQPNHHIFTHLINANDTIIFVNDAWLSFAQENDTPELTQESVLGQSLWSFIADKETRHLYQLILDKVRTSKSPVKLTYRCDSPTHRRFLEMEIVPTLDGSVAFNSHIRAQETRAAVLLLDVAADRSDEFVTICSTCKKVELPTDNWVEVEEAVQVLKLFEASKIPQLTHGMCPLCHENHLQELGSEIFANVGDRSLKSSILKHLNML